MIDFAYLANLLRKYASYLIIACVLLFAASYYKEEISEIYHGYGSDSSETDTADMCRDWIIESKTEKYIDGPELQDICQKYMAGRSAEEARADEAIIQSKIEAARVDWDAAAQKSKNSN